MYRIASHSSRGPKTSREKEESLDEVTFTLALGAETCEWPVLYSLERISQEMSIAFAAPASASQTVMHFISFHARSTRMHP